MGTFPALTHTRFHLCCRPCIVYCVLRTEIRAVESSLDLTLSRSGTVGARLLLIHWSFFPSFSCSYFPSPNLSAMGALMCSSLSSSTLPTDCRPSHLRFTAGNAAFRLRDLYLCTLAVPAYIWRVTYSGSLVGETSATTLFFSLSPSDF